MTKKFRTPAFWRRLAVFALLAVGAEEASACGRMAYAPGDPISLRFATIEDVFRVAPVVEMTASGEAFIELPRLQGRGTWSVSIDPVYFAAIWPLEGPRTAPTSGFRISYGFLHTAEAAALVTGDSRMLASTPWRERNALEAGLRIDYRSPGRAPRSITGRLVVQRGDPVFLAPEPVTVASDGPTTEGMVSAGRVFFLRLPPKGGQWRVDQAWNEDESGRRAEIQVVFDRTQEDGDYFRAMGNERVIQVIFAAPERLVFRLAVLPTPKC